MPDHGLPKDRSSETPHWRELAEQASQEPDGHKVSELVRKICDTLDEEDAQKKRKHSKTVAPLSKKTSIAPPKRNGQIS